MLVMSRRCDEEILFPNLGITVKVLRMQGNRVRLGVSAPEEIDVIRGELVGELDTRNRTSDAAHKLRNELNGLMLAARMFQMQMERGLEDKAHLTFLEMLHKLKQLDASYRPEAAPPVATVPASSGSHVLVVEDDANERELLAGLLRMEGCEVATAGDGGDALDQLAGIDQRPDVVLLDMHMPRVDGIETLSRIRSNPQLKDLLVFGVSGRTPNDVGLTVGTPDGIDDWFQKPLNPAEIVTRIRRGIRGGATVTA
jgi:carbon storage regulator CsrA